MQRSARYKTQSAIWDVEITGPLTDAAIRRYALAGRYGKEVQQHYQRCAASRQHKPAARRLSRLAQLFASL